MDVIGANGSGNSVYRPNNILTPSEQASLLLKSGIGSSESASLSTSNESGWDKFVSAITSFKPSPRKVHYNNTYGDTNASGLIDGTFNFDNLNSVLSSYFSLEDQIAKDNREFQQQSADRAMAFNAAEAEKNRSWQEQQNQVNREFQQTSADKAMAFSASEADKNRAWQEQMSNTAYQRSVADAIEAGINPMLIAQQGGASTPSAISGNGFAASGSVGSGSSASGAAASGSKADIDYSAVASYITSMINKSSQMYSSNVNAAVSLLGSLIRLA